MRLRTAAFLLLATGLAYGVMHHTAPTRVLAADSTNTLAIQGRITAADCPVNGDLDLVFEIHEAADPAGSTPALFTEAHDATPIRNGHFAVSLGAGNTTGGAPTPPPGVPASVFGNGGDRWVAIKLKGSTTELVTPRIKLSAVPFAIRSLSSADGGGVREINGKQVSSFLITAGRGIDIEDNATGDGIRIVSLGVIRVNGVLPSLGDLTLSGGSGVEVATDPTTGAVTVSLEADGSSVVTVNGQPPSATGDLALSVTGSDGVVTGGTGNAFTVALDPGVVRTFNGRQAANGDFRLVAGNNVTFDESGNSITIHAAGGGGSAGVSTLNTLNGDVEIVGTATGGVEVNQNGQSLELSLDPNQAVKSVNGKSGAVSLAGGTGISITNPQNSDYVVSVDPAGVVTSVEGQSGDVDLVGAGAVSVSRNPTTGQIEISAPLGGGGGVQTVGGVSPNAGGDVGVVAGGGISVVGAGNSLTFGIDYGNLDSRYAQLNNPSQGITAGSVTTPVCNAGTTSLGVQATFNQVANFNGGIRGPQFGGHLELQAPQGDVWVNDNLIVQGAISANVKNFVVDHPNDPTKQIVYCSLEGPECALYARGTAELKNGRARIQLPEHFTVLAVKDTMTVHLTPRGDTKGLYVKSQNPSRVVVRECQGGKSNVKFSYMVYAVRKGTEGHVPVRPKSN